MSNLPALNSRIVAQLMREEKRGNQSAAHRCSHKVVPFDSIGRRWIRPERETGASRIRQICHLFPDCQIKKAREANGPN